MHRWKFSALASAACLCAALTPTDAAALALGSINVQSHLGQPLRAEVDIPQLTASEAATLQTAIATPDIFRAHGVEYGNTARNVQIQLQRNPDGSAKLKLSTHTPVNEPFVDLIVQASWSAGNLVRSYTLLIDPTPAPQAKKPAAPVQVAPATTAPAAARPTPSAPPASTASTTGRSYPSQPRVPAAGSTPAAAPPSASQQTADSVTVQPGDTAGRLAATHRRDGVSLDQMLVAMLHNNPAAFIGNNVNRIKAGAVVQLPSQEQAQSTSAPEARKIIAAQSKDFNAFRQKLASRTSDAQLDSAQRSAEGKVQAQVEDTSNKITPSDKLTLSKGPVNAAAEEKLAQDKQASEQAARMQELQRNLSELEKLGESNTAATTTATTAATDSTPPSADTPAQDSTSSIPSIAVEANAPVTTEITPPAVAPDPEPAVEKPKKPRPAVVAPPPVPEPSLLDELLDNPLIPAGGAIAALLLGFLVWRSRKQRSGAGAGSGASTLDGSEMPPDSLFDSSGGQQVDTNSEGSPSTMAYSPSQLDANGDVDPIAEADVYLAYGKDEEAQKILREALRTTPNRLPIHLKLAEIQAKHKELKQLESTARTVQSLTQGQGSDWEQVRALGYSVDAGNPLYSDGQSPAPATGGAGAAGAAAASSDFAQALDAFDTPAASVSTPSPITAPSLEEVDAIVEGLPDLDLGLDLNVKDSMLPAADNTADQFIAALDSQLDIHAPDTALNLPTEINDTRFAEGALEAAAAAQEPAFDLGALDLSLPDDLSTTAPTTAPAPVASPEPVAEEALSLDGLDFSLDDLLSSSTPAPSAPAPEPAVAAVDAMSLEDFGLDALNLGDDSSAAASPSHDAPAAVDTLDALDTFGSLDNLETLGNLDTGDVGAAPAADDGGDGSDALGTKLDLAQEFSTIGDSEGARALIEEVLAEATGTMKVRAQKMLSELD